MGSEMCIRDSSLSVCVTLFLCFYTYRCRCLRARLHKWYLSVRYRDSRMLGQSARSIWRTCRCFLTVETGYMDPTNIIMFLLFFCVTGAMAVDPQLQKNQWNVLSGVTVWNGKPQYEFRINWFLLLCGALGAIVQDGWTLLQTARDEDLGGPANPGTPQQNRQSPRSYDSFASGMCSLESQLLRVEEP